MSNIRVAAEIFTEDGFKYPTEDECRAMAAIKKGRSILVTNSRGDARHPTARQITELVNKENGTTVTEGEVGQTLESLQSKRWVQGYNVSSGTAGFSNRGFGLTSSGCMTQQMLEDGKPGTELKNTNARLLRRAIAAILFQGSESTSRIEDLLPDYSEDRIRMALLELEQGEYIRETNLDSATPGFGLRGYEITDHGEESLAKVIDVSAPGNLHPTVILSQAQNPGQPSGTSSRRPK